MTTYSFATKKYKGWGQLYARASEKGVTDISFNRSHVPLAKKDSNEHLELLFKELDLYFASKLKKFSVKIDLSAETDFTQKVLKASRQIPSGKTLSYGELAKKINKPGAARAVGQAMGRNPLLMVLP
jgi:O6-methylguanine-DNA--protein-cysteine methyltransferase